MLLTVVSSVTLILLSNVLPGIHHWAVTLVQRLRFEDLILHGILGLLLFAGAFLLDLTYLSREKLTVALLSTIGTLLSTSGLALLMHSCLPLLGVPSSWLECLFFGALISPTDPIAVLEMLHRVGVAKNIQAQLAGNRSSMTGWELYCFLPFWMPPEGLPPPLPMWR